jgi:hypothetical protein
MTGHKMAVAAADSGRAHFDQHLSLFGIIQLNFFDHQGLTHFIKDGSFVFHVVSLASNLGIGLMMPSGMHTVNAPKVRPGFLPIPVTIGIGTARIEGLINRPTASEK